MEGTGGLEWRRDATSNVNHLDQGWNATSIGSTVKRSRIMHGHFATEDNLGGGKWERYLAKYGEEYGVIALRMKKGKGIIEC